MKAIIERGDVLVPNSDDLIADLEAQAQEAEAEAAVEALPMVEKKVSSLSLPPL